MRIILIVTLAAIFVDCKRTPDVNAVIENIKLFFGRSDNYNNKSSEYVNQDNAQALRKHKHKKHENQEKYLYWDKDERWEKKQRKKNKHQYSEDSDEYREKKHRHKKHKDKDRSDDSKDSISDETDEYREKHSDSDEYEEKKHRHKKHKDKYSSDDSKDSNSDETDEYRENHSDQDRHWDIGTHILNLKGNLRKRFAYECMQALNGGSSACSPLSALKPIGMLAFGAEGNSLNEILRAIGIDNVSSVKKHFKDILNGMTPRTSGLHMASRIYIHNDNRLHSSFKEKAENVFGSCIEQIDFRVRSKTAFEINDWVTYHTNKRVPGLVSVDDIPLNAVAIIVDALYFWGRWKHPFTHSKSETFYGRRGARSDTMMSNVKKYMYGSSRELDAQVIQIPYLDRDMKLIVLLPQQEDGLMSLIGKLKSDPDLINNVRMAEKKVHLQIPKFQIETTVNLKTLYQRIGLKEIFDYRTALTKVLDGEKVLVSNGLQRSIIVIDQEGTEAGSGMGLGYGATFDTVHEENRDVVFNANHPFMFFITLKKQQLFAGILQ